LANNYVNITLDTTAPSGLVVSLDGGATYSSGDFVTVTVSVDDATTTGYQIKLWGDVDPANDLNVQTLEADSGWIGYATSYQVRLSAGDGTKTIYARVRDDVYNASAQAEDSITKDTAKPVVTVTNPDNPKISKIEGRNLASFTFTCDVPFVEYRVKVVGATGAGYDTGTIIPVTNGSVNTSGTGTFDTSTAPIDVQVTGADLELASAGDTTKIVKVFCRDEAGNWSA
jgi:hypothetical protein